MQKVSVNAKAGSFGQNRRK